jgi:hypothetical protein
VTRPLRRELATHTVNSLTTASAHCATLQRMPKVRTCTWPLTAAAAAAAARLPFHRAPAVAATAQVHSPQLIIIRPHESVINLSRVLGEHILRRQHRQQQWRERRRWWLALEQRRRPQHQLHAASRAVLRM